MPQFLIGSSEIWVGLALMLILIYFFPSVVYVVLIGAILLVVFKIISKFVGTS